MSEAKDFRLVIVPAQMNPEGENLLLVLTEDEYQRAKRRGETVLRNRGMKGVKVNFDGYPTGHIQPS